MPKLLLTLAAVALLAEASGGESVGGRPGRDRRAGLGEVARRRFERTACRLPDRAPRARQPPPPAPFAERVYVIVIDGCNRERLWQA